MGAGGRPSDYTIWKARAVCMRLTLGESLRKICDRKGYPSRYAIFRWLSSIPEFRNQYAEARELQQELLYDELFEIADNSSQDYIETEQGKKLDSEHVQRSRLRIDTRKWVMERMAAKRYGAKQQLDHVSSDKSMTPKAYSPEQYKAAEEAISSKMDDLD